MDSENYNWNYNWAVSELGRVVLEEYNNESPIITKTLTSLFREKPWITGNLKQIIKRRQTILYLFKKDVITSDQLE